MGASAIQTGPLPDTDPGIAAPGALPLAERAFRLTTVALTLAVPALLCLCVAYVAEPDIWWHLSSGDWILCHHAFPHVDPFSSSTMGQPWQAYTWLFDVLLSSLFQHFGLAGIVSYTCVMVLLITAAFLYLVRSAVTSLRVALPLTLAGGLALLTLYSPRPWHFTVLFFIMELALIQAVRRSGRLTPFLWLPLLFALWANLHIQFIDGLLLLLLLLLEAIFGDADTKHRQKLSPSVVAGVLLLCVAATLLNPYGWHIYTAAHDLATQRGVVDGIEELKAMPFRSPANYLVLFLSIGAAARVARRRSLPVFEDALLLGTAILSFRSQRDIWLVVAASIAILSQDFSAEDSHSTSASNVRTTFAAGACAVMLLLGAAQLIRLSDRNLQPKLQMAMPVQAAAFIREHGIKGPVFCDFVWGGYLIHALRLPVSIDGRAALHGDEQIERSARTWSGAPDWSSNPQLASAGVIVAPRSAALSQLLRTDARFRRVYEDKLAAVFIPR